MDQWNQWFDFVEHFFDSCNESCLYTVNSLHVESCGYLQFTDLTYAFIWIHILHHIGEVHTFSLWKTPTPKFRFACASIRIPNFWSRIDFGEQFWARRDGKQRGMVTFLSLIGMSRPSNSETGQKSMQWKNRSCFWNLPSSSTYPRKGFTRVASNIGYLITLLERFWLITFECWFVSNTATILRPVIVSHLDEALQTFRQLAQRQLSEELVEGRTIELTRTHKDCRSIGVNWNLSWKGIAFW